MNKVIDKGFRSCRFVSTIVKHPVRVETILLADLLCTLTKAYEWALYFLDLLLN